MQPHERATFDSAELAVVLSHYDLGVIESVTEYPRGSWRSPKVGVVAARGKFLLKRRGIGRADPDRVRFAHMLQAHLSSVGFPTPSLVRPSNGADPLLQIRESVYELFEFVAGQAFQRTSEEARDAGAVLARFHHEVQAEALNPPVSGHHGDYHDAQGVRTGLCSIGASLSSHDSFAGEDAELAPLVQFLLSAYDDAAEVVNEMGFGEWPERIIHSDWHPGNLLFQNLRVSAVIDYDALRVSRRVIDIANGLLQFSMMAGGDPASWPDHLDEDRFGGFLEGYETLCPLEGAERNCLPYLMAEALIAECVPPITRTGSMGRWTGYRVLQMVRRKLLWLKPHGGRLVGQSPS